jgi:hypothetical protein
MTKPNSTETISVSDLQTIEEVANYINKTLFSGIPIVTKSALYDLISRPHTAGSNKYRNYINIEKVYAKVLKT